MRWYLAGSSWVERFFQAKLMIGMTASLWRRLLQVEREALQHLQVEDGDHRRAQDHAGDAAQAAQDDHREHADGLHEGEGLRADEGAAGGEEHAHRPGEGSAQRRRPPASCAPGGCPWRRRRVSSSRMAVQARPILRVVQAAGDDDDDQDDHQGSEVEEQVVETRLRRCCDPRWGSAPSG